MELRRALLLFAIVLGLAAIATSLSRPPESGRDTVSERGKESPPTPNPGPGSVPVSAKPRAPIIFRAGEGATKTESVKAGDAASVWIVAGEGGEAAIEGLGLQAYAEPGAPARFEVLSSVPGRYALTFTPTAGGEVRKLGFLQVTP